MTTTAPLTARTNGRPRPTAPTTAPTPLPVRARLLVTVTVDPAAWHREYGTGTTPAAVRADLTAYLNAALRTAQIYPALAVEVNPA